MCGRSLLSFFIDQDALGRAVEVIVLTAVHRPQEPGQAEQSHDQRGRYEDRKTGHSAAFRKRREFPTTSNDDSDIASAATSGVAKPAIATGTAKAL